MAGTKRNLLLFCTVACLSFVGNVSAYPLLGDILDLAEFDSLPNSEQNYVALESSQDHALATLLMECAGFAQTNKVGIYNPADTTQSLELFDGSASAIDFATVTFDMNTHQAWINPEHKVNIGRVFGFYLDSSDNAHLGGGLFYSNEQLNTGIHTGTEHVLIFDTSEFQGTLTGNPDVVVAFEDLKIYSPDHGDFDDLVLGISHVTVVPEPATILMLGIGSLSLVGRGRLFRKKS